MHLHAQPDRVEAKVLAAYHAGCRRFDSLGGLGGCPFAQNALVGNIATERAVPGACRGGRAAAEAPESLTELLSETRTIAGEFGPTVQ